MKDSRLTNTDLEDQSIYIRTQSIQLVGTTKFTLQKLLSDGDITERACNDTSLQQHKLILKQL